MLHLPLTRCTNELCQSRQPSGFSHGYNCWSKKDKSNGYGCDPPWETENAREYIPVETGKEDLRKRETTSLHFSKVWLSHLRGMSVFAVNLQATPFIIFRACRNSLRTQCCTRLGLFLVLGDELLLTEGQMSCLKSNSAFFHFTMVCFVRFGISSWQLSTQQRLWLPGYPCQLAYSIVGWVLKGLEAASGSEPNLGAAIEGGAQDNLSGGSSPFDAVGSDLLKIRGPSEKVCNRAPIFGQADYGKGYYQP